MTRDFMYTLQSTCQAALHHGNEVTVFTNGVAFYPAMLQAISQATRAINMELYIFQPGENRRSIRGGAVSEGAQGVTVTIVVDALGSLSLWGRPCAGSGKRGAGSSRISGCSGIRWRGSTTARTASCSSSMARSRSSAARGSPTGGCIPQRMRWRKPWRDTMARVEGPVVAALQGVAAENWLECCGEILTGPDYFPNLAPAGDTTAFVVKSSPSDRATASRVTFQMLMEAADRFRPHHHAVLPARPGTAAGARRNRLPRRRDHRDRARATDRSEMGAARQPPDVGTAPRGRHPYLRIPAPR